MDYRHIGYSIKLCEKKNTGIALSSVTAFCYSLGPGLLGRHAAACCYSLASRSPTSAPHRPLSGLFFAGYYLWPKRKIKSALKIKFFWGRFSIARKFKPNLRKTSRFFIHGASR
jgi:hypothetical protein